MSWKPYWIIPSEGAKHCTNGQAFATEDEALASAYARFCNWTVPTGYGADESDKPVTYVWDPLRGDMPLKGA